MRIGSNIVLRGDAWAEVIDTLKPVIDTFYGVYVISVAIGIHADKQIESLEANLYPEARFEINRAMMLHDSQTWDLLFKSAIITTANVDFSEDLRMELAFNDDTKAEEAKNFNQMGFLTKFANFGVTQLSQHIAADPLESMEALNKYVIECTDGLRFNDFDLDDLELGEDNLEEN
jgi:hypothetical protein